MQNNFNNYDMLRIDEAPQVEVHIVQSTANPGGIGGSGSARDRPGCCRKRDLRRDWANDICVSCQLKTTARLEAFCTDYSLVIRTVLMNRHGARRDLRRSRSADSHSQSLHRQHAHHVRYRTVRPGELRSVVRGAL